MEIPVLIEPLADSGFRATSGEPLHLETEAPTREEAITKLRHAQGRPACRALEASDGGVSRGRRYRHSMTLYVLDTDTLVLF
jgi:hypothetical protein